MYSTSPAGYVQQPSYASPLEQIAMEYATAPVPAAPLYLGVAKSSYKAEESVAEEQPVFFLNPSRPATPFVGDVLTLSGPIREAFLLTTGEALPSDILITIAPREQLVAQQLSFLQDSVMGLSVHSTREIFVVAGSMDSVLLTVGHELGHIIAPVGRTAEEEEAKAFAFESAWARTIFEHDVAGLRDSINAAAFLPAKNGVHDVAFSFVKNNSAEPMKLFRSISAGEVSHEQVVSGVIAYPVLRGKRMYASTGYLNKSRVQNFAPPHNFFWGDLGRGIYGMYVPATAIETLNETLLRKDIEQMHKTLGHEYSLHHVMGLPDGYVAEALEEAMFWTKDEEDSYYV